MKTTLVLLVLAAVAVNYSSAASLDRARRQLVPSEFRNVNIDNYLKVRKISWLSFVSVKFYVRGSRHARRVRLNSSQHGVPHCCREPLHWKRTVFVFIEILLTTWCLCDFRTKEQFYCNWNASSTMVPATELENILKVSVLIVAIRLFSYQFTYGRILCMFSL